MSLSLTNRDVRILAGMAAVAAGLIAVGVGAFTGNIPMVTVGAGLLGAPGIATATTTATTKPATEEGTTDE